MDLRDAIDAGDAGALERLLSEDRSQANALIHWGKGDRLLAHPLHYVCDKVFDRTLRGGRELPLVRALLDAGAYVDFRNGDPLHAAASLGAIDVAFMLLDAGASSDAIGPGGETPMHWAAFIGAEDLVGRLIALGAPLEARDTHWNGTPLAWAIHGWSESPVPADRGGHREVVLRLARAGASVQPEWLTSKQVIADKEVAAALRERAG